MECSSCGFENHEGSRFCEECGTLLTLRCPSCSAEHRAGQKFCGECGTALTGAPAPTAAPAPAPSAVRKTVTVLFADLGGSTGFGERTDAEVSRQVLARYHALLQDVIDAHAGTVAKFMGDGMMATFGIPEVAEDDARRAVDAGAAMQQRFHEFAADVERGHGETLTLRVGINTGEVVIGEGDADLIGDALNVAARLEKACRPGHVLVGEETWRLTRADIAYESLGEVNVAGRAQPVAIYEVAADAEAEPEVAAPFVGRDAEMRRLVGVFDDACGAANARLVTVLGSPGVGKTRLSRELCARLAEHGDAQRLELRCDRAGEATFEPVAQLIRDASGITEDLEPDAARAAIGLLVSEDESDHTRVVDVLAGLVGVGPTRSVEETFWGVRRLVETRAAARPLVVVIDDIQWAEPLLLDLIEHLAEWVADAAVLIVGLARPELREVRPSLAEPGRPVAAVVVLDGLDASATEALAAGLLGTERLPTGLVERLPASTDGNPLFVRELMRMLVDDRVIRRRDDGEWELTIDAEAVDVPPTIQSLLGARVERLPAAERELLEQASVVGAEFSLGALRELAGERAPIASLLETMRRKELVEPTGTYWGDEPVHRFHHVLIRDAAYRRLLKTTRAELHERIAVWTDATAADLVGEHEAATAFHYEQAYRYRTELGDPDGHAADLGRRAAELLTTAAQRALGRDDLASAGALSARALALLPESDAAARADLLQMGCECLLASGDGAAAQPLVEELGRSTADDPRLAAWAECYTAQLVGLTDPEGLVAADAQAQAAAAALTELGDGSGQAKAHQVRAGLLARLGRVGDCELELDLALAAARAADDRRRVTAVLGAAPDAALFGPSPVARAGGRCLDVVRLLRITTASPAVEAASNRCQAVLESLRGRFDVSRSMLASARAALEELGLRHGLAQTELFAGMVEMIAGDPHAAIPPLRAALGGLGALGSGADAGSAAALLARALLVDGQVDEANEMATASEQLAGQNLKTAIGWRVARAEVLASRDDLAGAVALAEQAVEIAAGTDLVIDHADACVALATLRARAGDAAGARTSRADAKRLYEQKGATVPAERLDEAEVAAPAPSTAPAPQPAATAAVPSLENTASRVFAWATEAVGSDAAAELAAPEYRFDDRRRVVNLGTNDVAAATAYGARAREDGQRVHVPGAVAVRGDRLALCWTIAVTDAGDDSSSFAVAEVDERGRLVSTTHFDVDDLVAAQAELEARYLAGEAAEHTAEVGSFWSWLRTLERNDFDAIREQCSPDLVFVDHQQIGWGTGGLGEMIELMAAFPTVRSAFLVTRMLAGDRVILTTVENRATTPDGGDLAWVFHTLGVVDEADRASRIELFAEDDWDAALARFDELRAEAPADPRHPRVENRSSRVLARYEQLVSDERYEEAAALYADDLVATDRRSGVSVPPLGPVDLQEGVRLTFDLFDGFDSSNLAVRGERLVLSKLALRTHDGLEVPFLQLFEIDDADRIRATTHFDPDALTDAIAELDERYVAGEGAEHADLVAANAAWFRAMNQHDVDAMRELAAPGFVFVDHRRLGTGILDIDGFLHWEEGYADVHFEMIVVDLQVRGRVDMVTAVNRALDADGGDILWSFHVVGVFDPAGGAERVEAFATEDRDAAVARFEELSCRGEGPPPIENAETRNVDRIFALINAGRWDEVAEWFVPDFVRVDHRTGVADASTERRDEYLSAFRAVFDVGFTSAAVEHLAIRGDRLGLMRSTFTTDAGAEMMMLSVGEIDESGRESRLALYDPDDLDAAVSDLDERYTVGEGAEHAVNVQLVSAWARALNRNDFDAIRELAEPGLTLVDRRQMGWTQLNIDEFIAFSRQYVDMRVSYLTTTLRTRGGSTLSTQVNHAIDTDGGDFEWRLVLVGVVGPEGRAARAEMFDEGDWDAALARFEELAGAPSDPRTPRSENAFTRRRLDWEVLVRSGRFDDARARLGEFFAEDVVRIDRRSTVAAPDADGPGMVDSLQAMYELGLVEVAADPIAVRGDSLALHRQVFASAAGDELVLLNLTECDASGLVVFVANYDENQLAEALAELDARFLAGEGAEHATVLRAYTAAFGAMQSVDFAAMAAHASPEFGYVDHRPASFGSLDARSFARMAKAYDDVDRTSALTKIYFGERALVGRLWTRGVTAEGGEAEWINNTVFVVDDAGRALHAELFAEDDWDAALARFDELSAESVDHRTPRVENAATRASQRVIDLTVAGRYDDAVALFLPEFERDDRRHTVAAPPVTTVAQYMDSFRAILEQFDTITIEPVAVRGDRLHLSRTVFTTETGFETVFWQVAELDADGLIARIVNFDEDDLASAVAELDVRYVAGEGAADAYLICRAGDFVRSMAELDGTATLALIHPDVRWTDHRALGFGTAGFEGVRGVLEARAEDTAEDRSYFRDLAARGSTMMGHFWSAGIGPDGDVAVLYEFHWVARWVAGKMHDIDWYDLDDVDAARARFDELSAESVDERTPEIVNASTRMMDRLWAAAGEQRFDEVAAMLAPDVERVDHRRGVSGPPTHGVDEYLDVLRAAFGQGEVERVVVSPLAVRGERLSLSWVVAHALGFEVSLLMLTELDEEGRLALGDVYDEDDLAGAVAELDARSVDLIGPVPCPGEARLIAGVQALNRRDWDGFRAFHPDFVAIDHSPLGFPPTDAEGFLRDQMQSMAALVPDFVVVLRKILAVGRAALALGTTLGTTTEGNEYRWDFVQVTLFDGDGRLQQRDLYSEAQWAEALARFDEVAAEPPPDPRHPRAENAATRLNDRYQELLGAGRTEEAQALAAPDFVLEDRRRTVSLPDATSSGDLRTMVDASVDLLAPDVVQVDRRHGVAAPDLVGRDARVENLAAVAATFGGIEVGYVAVRGERLALIRWTITADGGFHVTGYDLNELDADGRICRIVTFDDSQLRDAVEELERRHRELRGDAYSPVERVFAEQSLAANRGDLDAVAALRAADYELVDHSPIGSGRMSSSWMIELHRAMSEQMEDMVLFPVRVYAAGPVGLGYFPLQGVTSDGFEAEWEFVIVKILGETGLLVEEHLFQVEQWDEALALFDERSLENRATAAGHLAREAALRGDRAATLDAFAPDFTRIEHRPRALSLDPVVGRDLYVDGMIAGPDAGLTRFDATTLEVAGDDHALTHVLWHNGDGFAQEWLIVGGVDEDGRFRRIANFDPDDGAAASALLHEWAAEPPASAGALVNRATRGQDAYCEAFAARDWDAMAATYAEDIVSDDRRTGVSSGITVGREEVLGLVRGLVDVGFATVTTVPIAIRGEGLAIVRRTWHQTDGFELPLLAVVEHDADGRTTANVMFDADDVPSAYEELERRHLAERDGRTSSAE